MIAAIAAVFIVASPGRQNVTAQDGSAGRELFVRGMGDVPLMPRLVEAPGGGLVFDTPAGRIAEAYAGGPVTKSQVIKFYAGALPQLGWRRQGDLRFFRESEILVIEVRVSKGAGDDKGVSVRFALSPADPAKSQ